MRMNNRFVFSPVLFAALLGLANAQGPSVKTDAIQFSGLELGQSHPMAKIHARVEGVNVSGRTLSLDRIVANEPGVAAFSFKPIEVKAGESFGLDIEVALSADVGRVSHHFDVFEKGQSEPVDGFSVQGFSDWVISPEGTDIQFGIVDSAKPVERIVPIQSRPGVAVRLLGIEKGSAHFDARVIDDGRALELKSRKDAPWSNFDEKVLVRTDNELQPIVAFRIRGQSRGAVIPSADPLDFGVLREGQGAELTLVLNDSTGKALKIGKVVPKSRMPVETKVTECIPANPSCKNLKVIYPPMNLRGVTGGMLEIELPEYERTLYVRFGALGIGKDTKIMDLAEELERERTSEKPVSTVLRNAIQKPPVPLEMPKPEGNGPLLTWKSAYENGVYGYEVYRSEAKGGPFQRVSAGIIERLDQSGKLGSVYRWRDANFESGKDYWYYVNLVMNDGSKRTFTSAQMVHAK